MDNALESITLTDVVQIATLASLLVATIGFFFGVRVYRRQMNAQLFLEYTRRYEEVMASFPPDHRSSRFDLDGEPPPESQELRAAVLRYLNLCSEEFYLNKRGYLSKDIWSIWEDELKRTLRSPLVRREWQVLRREFTSYSQFARYVEREHSLDRRAASDANRDQAL